MANIQYTAYVNENKEPPKIPTFDFGDIPILGKRKPKQEVVLNPLPEMKTVSPTDVPAQQTTSIVKGITDNSKKYNLGNMQHIVDAFENAGISIRITSGVRPGAMTKSGHRSHHSLGNAIDITPNFAQGETWDSMRRKLKDSQLLGQYLRDHKIGIIDETTPEVMQKTGATGAHWHIGPDQWALRNLETLLAKKGAKLMQGGDTIYAWFNDKSLDRQNITYVPHVPGQYVKQYDLTDKPRVKDEDFDRWYAYVSKALNLDPNPDAPEHHYNYREYYNDVVAPSGNQYAVIPVGFHFPDKYKTVGHPTYSTESKYYQPGQIAGHWEGDTYRTTPLSKGEMEARQQYAETRFKKGRVSSAGAKGAYQFMPSTWAGLNKKYGLNLNIEDYNDNKKMRDLYIDDLMHNDLIRTANEPSRVALAYAAYNMGIGNLKKFIEKEANKGIDVYTTWDWIDDLNPETKKYVNFIVRGIDGNGDLTAASFNKALPNRFEQFPEVNND